MPGESQKRRRDPILPMGCGLYGRQEDDGLGSEDERRAFDLYETGYDAETHHYVGDVTVGYSSQACAYMGFSCRAHTTLHNPTAAEVADITDIFVNVFNEAVEQNYKDFRAAQSRYAWIQSGMAGFTQLTGRAGDGFSFVITDQDKFNDFIAGKNVKHGKAITHGKDAGCSDDAPCTDNRTLKGSYGLDGSIQVVYNGKRGGYLDLDRNNPYEFPTGTIGHIFGEIIFKNKGPVAVRPPGVSRAVELAGGW